MKEEVYHIPALLKPTIDALITDKSGIYVDATFGGAGHSRAILAELSPCGRLFAFDRDLDATANIPDDPRFTFVHSDFRFIPNFLHFHGVEKVDGILADLGVSFHHFDTPERGFSFRVPDAPLDMRMNQNSPMTAAKLLNNADKDILTRMFLDYTDLTSPGKFADAIVKGRSRGELATVGDLLECITPLISERAEKKQLAQVFQAIRIQVNDEMRSLRHLLQNAPKVLKPEGRLVILTYHSIEDRMVKRFMRSGNIDGQQQSDIFGTKKSDWKTVGKPLSPSPDEIEANPRSRSAKLRIAEYRPQD